MPLWACWPHQSISSKGLQSQLNVGTNATFLNVFGGTNHAMIGATSHFTQVSIQETLTPSSHVELMQKSEMNLFHDMISILFCGYLWVCIYIYTTSKLFCFVPCSTKMLTGPSKAGQSPPSNSDHGPPRSDEMPPCSTSLRAARWYFEQLMVRPTTNLERGPRVWKEGNLS